MDTTVILSGLKLLWDIYKEVTNKTIDAERNSELDTGDKKHKYVHQELCHIIDGKKICANTKEGLKEKLNSIIKEQVQTMNEKGMFYKE